MNHVFCYDVIHLSTVVVKTMRWFGKNFILRDICWLVMKINIILCFRKYIFVVFKIYFNKKFKNLHFRKYIFVLKNANLVL